MAEEFIFDAECKIIRDLAHHVRNTLGGGWNEEAYHQAMVLALDKGGVPIISKERRSLVYHGAEIHTFEPDIIAWDKIVLELKVQPQVTRIQSAHLAQVLPYLKFFNKQLGVLMNFGPAKFWMKRIIYEPLDWMKDEDYRYWEGLISAEDRIILAQIRAVIFRVARQFGMGYSESIYRKLLTLELENAGIPCLVDTNIPAKWDQKTIHTQSTHHLLVANRYLLHVRALIGHPSRYDFFSTKTYLSALGLKFGLIANFHSEYLQLKGVIAS